MPSARKDSTKSTRLTPYPRKPTTPATRAIWPAQIVAYGLGLLVVWALLWKARRASLIACGTLALFWVWNGVSYHLLHFSRVNAAAVLFGALFIVQGGIFAAMALRGEDLPLQDSRRWRRRLGNVMIIYAAVIYSSIGWLAGHRWPGAPVFGVAPCPTAIFTIGELLTSGWLLSPWLVAGPFVWALIGSSAAILLGVIEDLGLVAAAVALAAALITQPLRLSSRPQRRLQL